MTRKTIGDNPLDAWVTTVESVNKKPHGKKKQKVTLIMDADLVERLKNAVYWSPGLSLSGVLEEAAEKMISQLEKKNGKPFQERNGELKKGRKLS
jgi:hypothetical protein